MKGVSYNTNEANERTSVVIDIKYMEKHEDEIHEFTDVLVAESRKGEESISWDVAKKQLKTKGKL